MKLRYYVMKRLLYFVFILLGISLMTFLISHLVPGDPIAAWYGTGGEVFQYGEDVIEKMKHEMGLDRPLYEQYGLYIWKLLHGDLGKSILTKRPIAEELIAYFPATLELSLVAIILAMIIGIPLGVLSAVKRNKPIDHSSRVFALVGVSMPIFWLGLVVVIIFYYHLGWIGIGRIGADVTPPTPITGLYILDSLLTLNFPALVSSIKHIIAPALVLGYYHAATFCRITRSSMLDVFSRGYITTARSKGLSERVVIYKHALKNALIPTVTLVGLTVGGLLSGAVVTETIFAWPGVGRYITEASLNLDFPVIVGASIFIAFIFSFSNLIVDLVYGYLDPRIRYG